MPPVKAPAHAPEKSTVQSPNDISWRRVMDYATELKEAFVKRNNKKESEPKLIRWSSPIAGKIKVNTDGSRKQEGHGGFGGLIRDHEGNWMGGFMGNLPICNALEAELHGILKGLQLIKDKGIQQAILETDAETGRDLLTKDYNLCHPLINLILDYRFLLRATGSEIIHVLREGNCCAELMANLGANQDNASVKFEEPLRELVELLRKDATGVCRFRL